MSIDPAPVDSSPPWHDDSEKDIKGEHWDPTAQDAFGNEETAEVKYKVLEWWYVRLVPHPDSCGENVNRAPGNVVYVCVSPESTHVQRS